ncbi:MAG: APC family permease [Gemmatimonadales bacterium]|nr:APC family permease [Gemmatimonadales bacterium]
MSDGPRLARDLGLWGLVATGVCSMVGAGLNIVPFMIQRHVPGIGPWVVPAYLLAAVPALLAALAYAILASAMPRAGGSYVYASRGLSPYLGFVASFSQWAALAIAIGVVSYVLPPFLRDLCAVAGLDGAAATIERGPVRLAIAFAALGLATLVNLRGVRTLQLTLVPLMLLTLGLGAVVIVAGWRLSPGAFLAAAAPGASAAPPAPAPFSWGVLLPGAALLFSSFIGFDAIAQAGGEARDPGRTLPRAIGIAIVGVGAFYLAFTAAVYHAVPWHWLAEEARTRDVTAPGLLGRALPTAWAVPMVAGAAVALAKDLPAMLLGVSRLMFAWADDGIMPAELARLHPVRRTPDAAILCSAALGAVSILGGHLAGDFFLGVDFLVTAMLVNFVLMCATVLALPARNPALAAAVTVLPDRRLQAPLAWAGIALLGGLLAVHTWRDLTAPRDAWYFRSTPVWLLIMAVGTAIYLRERRAARRAGRDLHATFATLPAE